MRLISFLNRLIFFFLIQWTSVFASVYFDWGNPTTKENLLVTIQTERLILRSVIAQDTPDLMELFADSTVMRKFATGEPRSHSVTAQRIKDVWLPRWKKNDPRSPLAVFLRDDLIHPIGLVVLAPGEGPGRSELSYLFFTQVWGQKYAKEAVTSIVREYVPALIDRKYDFGGSALTQIDATASPDNIASCKILTGLGFVKAKEDELKYGMMKKHFMLPVRVLGEVIENRETKNLGTSSLPILEEVEAESYYRMWQEIEGMYSEAHSGE
jgi:RimJ/RimL family protein N-acetyltransferase